MTHSGMCGLCGLCGLCGPVSSNSKKQNASLNLKFLQVKRLPMCEKWDGQVSVAEVENETVG